MQAVNISEKHMIAANQNLKERDYWLRKLSPIPDKTIIPYDFQPTGLGERRYDSIHFVFPRELCAAVLRVSNKSDIRLFVLLTTGVLLLLNKYTGSKDIVVGIPIYRQEAAGEFVNTVLPLRTSVEEQWTARELLLRCGQAMREAAENQNFPIEVLLQLLHIHFSPQDDFPLFDVSLLLRNLHEEKHINHIHTNISFFFSRRDNLIRGRMRYNALLYDEQTAAVLVGRLERLLANCLSQLDTPIVNVEMVSEAEKRQILEDFNDPDVDFPKGKTIHRLFAEQVEKTPHHIAVVCQNINLKWYRLRSDYCDRRGKRVESRHIVPYEYMSITYREINRRSDRLARLLWTRGVKPNTIVGIMAGRSVDTIVGMMGILKVGGAYLPIDPDYPEGRIEFMLADSSTRVMLTTRTLAEEVEKFRSLEVETMCIEEIGGRQKAGGSREKQCRSESMYSPEKAQSAKSKAQSESYQEIRSAPCAVRSASSPDSLAYIIYTSGTTGWPKGVMIEHRNVVRLMFNDAFQFDFKSSDTWTMYHSPCFDFSVWEMYGALLYGGQLVIIPGMIARDSRSYLDVLKEKQVSVLNQTPSVFYNLVDLELDNPARELNIRYVIFGGETLNPSRLKGWKLKYPKTKLINMYGITETTVHVTFKELTRREIESGVSIIGRPIPTLTTYILDKHYKLLPTGVPGELFVSGKGVGRGYLNRPGLTREKFLENPYKAGEILYRSGDLVKLSDNRDMEFLGRTDHQVKIRGFRIELGEIENLLLKHDDIKEAVVLSRGNETSDKYLCAYVVPGKEIRVPALKEYLLKKLPDHMVPSQFVFLEQIPLTSNGKINRQYLRELEIEVGEAGPYAAPANEVEFKLVEIWKELLKVEELGINDNFFDSGGHSLRAMMLASKIQKEFGVKISQAELFRLSTIRELSAYIREEKQEQYLAIMLTEKKDYYQLSQAQKRLFFIYQLNEDSTAYNILNVMSLKGNLNREKFRSACIELIKRHESLRTSFLVLLGEPVQRIHDEVEFKVKYYPYQERWREDIVKNYFIRPFDLTRAPLLTIGLIKKDSDEYILIINMHHIISDGFSIGIMVQDFLSLYRGNNLVKPRIQYKDFSEWQRTFLKTEEFKKQEDYWLNALKGEVPVLNIPTDYPRPAVRDIDRGDFIVFALDQVLRRGINEVVRKTNTTLFILLLAAYNVLLYKYTGQEDIIVGTAVTGRSEPDLQEIIGCFMNMLALRNKPAKNITFREFLEEVKENSLKVYENQDYPYDRLVKKLGLQGNTSRNLLFDTEFAMGNIDIPALEIPGLKISVDRDLSKFAKFDLHFLAAETGNVITIQLRYSTEIFKRQTVEKIKRNYIEVLEQIVGDSDIAIEDIRLAHDLLPSKSNIKEQLHGDFRL